MLVSGCLKLGEKVMFFTQSRAHLLEHPWTLGVMIPDVSLIGAEKVICEGNQVIKELQPDVPVGEVLAPIPIFAHSQILKNC